MQISELIYLLSSKGWSLNALPGDAETWLIVSRDERIMEPPVRLQVTQTALREQLQSLEEDATFLFPDVTPSEAAVRLFLVHLDEQFDADVMPVSLRITPKGFATAWPASERAGDGARDAGQERYWTDRRPE
jgi:hypothetical protein